MPSYMCNSRSCGVPKEGQDRMFMGMILWLIGEVCLLAVELQHLYIPRLFSIL